MRKLTTSTAAKITAVILTVVCAFIFVFSVVGISSKYVFYDESDENASRLEETNVYRSQIMWCGESMVLSDDVGYAIRMLDEKPAYAGYWESDDLWRSSFSQKCNLLTNIYDYSDGSVVYDDAGRPVTGKTPLNESDDIFALYTNADFLRDIDIELTQKAKDFIYFGDESSYNLKVIGVKVFENGIPDKAYTGRLLYSTDKTASGEGYTIAIMYKNGMVTYFTLRNPLVYADDFYMDSIMYRLYGIKNNVFIPAVCVSGLLIIVLLVYLMIAAGRKSTGTDGEIEIKPSRMERIPLDLFIVAVITVCSLIAVAVVVVSFDFGDICRVKLDTFYPLTVFACVMIFLACVLCVEFLMSCSVRFKLKKWWRNTVCWKLCSFVWKFLKKILNKIFGNCFKALASQIKEAVKSIGIQWKLVLVSAVIMFINVLAGYIGFWHEICLVLIFMFDIIMIAGILVTGLMMRKLEKGGMVLAEGNLNAKIDTDKLIGNLKRHGENLNSISDGLAAAVEERMKSERLKTELITNVSHDIKTPLTSIVNYVDLLDKENPEGKAAEYVDVLKRQSARLKKLTEDLMEASKAATGNINVDLKRINVVETINQAVGEYAEKLETAGLDVVTDVPDEPVIAMADGRLLWRVLDNLLSNVCKYSLSGTRVYVTVEMSGCVELSVKNISRDRLNVSADELMERFVRGDSSRNSKTEGSGLGLNIAKSLTELQGGKFELSVDGDLFKAVIKLNGSQF
jgi:signal transduction histidine kinase